MSLEFLIERARARIELYTRSIAFLRTTARPATIRSLETRREELREELRGLTTADMTEAGEGPAETTRGDAA